jgi:DNA-binding transcriptional LysR family regulator
MNEIDLRRFDLNLLAVFEVLMRERSVTLTAERLGRTQSAVSHSLARLRAQLGDPLLIKGGRRMEPTAFALEFIEQVRPLLRGIERVLSPRHRFEPASARRVFRLAAPDFALALFTDLLADLRAEAPGVSVEWTGPRETMLLEVVEGQVDIAISPARIRLPRASRARISARWNGAASPAAAIRRSANGAPGPGHVGRTWSSASAISSRARSISRPLPPASSERSPDGCPTSRSSRPSSPPPIF